MLCFYWRHLCISSRLTQRDENNNTIVLKTQGRNKKTDAWRAAFTQFIFFFFGLTASSGGLNHLLQLSVRETFIEFCRRENFKAYIYIYICIVHLIWHCEDKYQSIWNSTLVCDTLNSVLIFILKVFTKHLRCSCKILLLVIFCCLNYTNSSELL